MKRTTQLILALDVDNFQRARYLVNRLYPKIKIFKVGIQLFASCGPKIIDYIRKKGGQVFLDLKFFDIPHSVASAVAACVRLKVKMFTLHILGGKEMLRLAVRQAKEEALKTKTQPPLLMGVTLLTSKEVKSSDVLTLARLGLECGLDGIVCSAREARLLRQKIKRKFVLVTPGIRLKGISTDDQKRVATPGEAVRAGSDFLVIGRPILEAEDPVSMTERIIGEIYGRGD